MGKDTLNTYEAAVNRQETYNHAAGSSTSAVSLSHLESEYPDEDLPSYEETSSSAPLLSGSAHGEPSRNAHPVRGMSWYIYYVELYGTHTRTERRNNKDNSETITDFHVKLNLTHLLTTGMRTGGRLELLPDNQKGYRGGVVKSYTPSLSNGDMESSGDELQAWCEKYVADPSPVKSFMFERRIINHDTIKLKDLLKSLVASTNYRGNVHVHFTTKHKRVIVYSPNTINEWRMTPWVRWLFYLSFLWIISWPILFFLTRRYEVVKAFYQYADKPVGDEYGRKPTVLSEQEFFNHWEAALRRAVVGRLVRKDACLDDEYRIATLQEEVARGQAAARILNGGTTGSILADGIIGIIGAGTEFGREYNNAVGWGYDD
ncbi:ABC transporter protein [Rutstroemia sp. NJR-2017a BVV2]|nr:ABC transporter protein [Rutstroemia sp. NJR-2017a BVV2]